MKRITLLVDEGWYEALRNTTSEVYVDETCTWVSVDEEPILIGEYKADVEKSEELKVGGGQSKGHPFCEIPIQSLDYKCECEANVSGENPSAPAPATNHPPADMTFINERLWGDMQAEWEVQRLTHDELCGVRRGWDASCQCSLISKVVEREREIK
ncbi:hypothetical protein UFOVP965_91 [uncultured Caudovirales phage]|uniref:Uncharacterized protein n=1 Tax=uncultured Caudovirales phage TaxID=2100421 RepID=A0A6J5PXN5_9CAUD|nr:hypothetical protein UFOVP965_91 [uncultured Caudovirales phage]CAB4179863.1 hypothetical protein UFOVP1035_87 [uncultured Caudovirales phage]CAB4188660.1 hypothetical protein UFOVP1181_46 [uncultured Caudovirales phage]